MFIRQAFSRLLCSRPLLTCGYSRNALREFCKRQACFDVDSGPKTWHRVLSVVSIFFYPFDAAHLPLLLPLLPGRHKLALLPGVVVPAPGQRRSARLLCVVCHPLLELGAEVADQTLDGPGKGLSESYGEKK